MDFDINKVKSTVNARTAIISSCGYFANDLDSLRTAVERERSGVKSVYTCLLEVLSDKYEHRFGNECGNFALFYPTDKELNVARY